jgi:carbon-monoxide dehydrogenase medium subunit
MAPDSLKDLYGILKKNSQKARLLAGGTDILVEMHNNWSAPELIVDIKKIDELKKIDFNRKKGLAIGATAICFDIINDRNIKKYYPLLADAASRIGSYQLRNRATIGGNLCTASPCADMGCALLALDASVELGSASGTREVKLKDYFTGPKKTQLRPDEVLLRIFVPVKSANAISGMRKLKRIKGHDLALASVAIAKNFYSMRVGIGSCAPTPVVTEDLSPDAKLEEVKKAVFKVISPIDDVRASADYRRFITEKYVESIYDQIFTKGGRK